MNSKSTKIKSAVDRIFNPAHMRYIRKWLVLGILIGIVSGIGSIVFYTAIQWSTRLFLGAGVGYVPPVPAGEGPTVFTQIARPWMIPVVTTIGGLMAGLIVFRFAPEAEGHGTDAAINAFHNRGGFIRRRVPVVKIIASAITIGSGGSAGREGPVALIGAGFGSTVSDIFKLDQHDRRIALAVGIGSGVGSIFKAPLGGAVLSTEILYRRDFEFEALLPSFIASIVGFTIFGSYYGWTPVFGTHPEAAFIHPQELLGYAALGVACGLIGRLYGWSFYRVRDLFRSFNAPKYLKPAIGGLLVGIIGMFLPQILGMGYGLVQFAIAGNTAALPLAIMIVVIFAKIAATSLSIGSGGSGGVFAPGLVIGGMVGGAMWSALHKLTSIMPTDPGAFVIVGMMALFGGIAKAPLAIMIMVSEMTGEHSFLIPSMIAVVIAYFLTGDGYIYENQVNTRADSPAHRAEFSVPLLKKIRVGEAMVTNVITVSPQMTVAEIAALLKVKQIDAVPVVSDGKLVGIVAALDIARVGEDKWALTKAADIMTTKLIVGHPGEFLDEALLRMTGNNISHLLVVDPQSPDKLAGLLALHDIAMTYAAQKDAVASAD